MLMADFVTAVKYKLPIKVVIIKNNTLGQIKWEQMVFLGNPEYGVDLYPVDFAAFAHACGGTGFTVEDPKVFTTAWSANVTYRPMAPNMSWLEQVCAENPVEYYKDRWVGLPKANKADF